MRTLSAKTATFLLPGENVTLRARREAQGPQGLEGTPLRMSLETESELEQSPHEIVVCFAVVNYLAVAVSSSSSRSSRRGLALVLCQFFNLGQDLTRGQNPVHRD
jgi:hypothetical protein